MRRRRHRRRRRPGDLATLLGDRGGTGAGDLNADGVIGRADLAEMLAT